MNEIQAILAKYKPDYLTRFLASTPEADRLALAFYEDVAEILDILSRMKNVERNPTGFSIDDAPILGLLVRTWKLLKLVVWIYKEDSAEYAAIAERSLMEFPVTATYLLRSGASTMEGLPALLLREQVQDPRTSRFRGRVLPQQARATAPALDQGKAGLGWVGREQLRRTDRKRLASGGQDVPPHLRGCDGPCCMDHPEGCLIMVFFNTGDNLDAT